MICCVSPSLLNLNESLNALRYANRARNIKNKPIVNRDPALIVIDELKNCLKLISSQLLEARKSKKYTENENNLVTNEMLENFANNNLSSTASVAELLNLNNGLVNNNYCNNNNNHNNTNNFSSNSNDSRNVNALYSNNTLKTQNYNFHAPSVLKTNNSNIFSLQLNIKSNTSTTTHYNDDDNNNNNNNNNIDNNNNNNTYINHARALQRITSNSSLDFLITPKSSASNSVLTPKYTAHNPTMNRNANDYKFSPESGFEHDSKKAPILHKTEEVDFTENNNYIKSFAKSSRRPALVHEVFTNKNKNNNLHSHDQSDDNNKYSLKSTSVEKWVEKKSIINRHNGSYNHTKIISPSSSSSYPVRVALKSQHEQQQQQKQGNFNNIVSVSDTVTKNNNEAAALATTLQDPYLSSLPSSTSSCAAVSLDSLQINNKTDGEEDDGFLKNHKKYTLASTSASSASFSIIDNKMQQEIDDLKSKLRSTEDENRELKSEIQKRNQQWKKFI
jgi:hypothetical protein